MTDEQAMEKAVEMLSAVGAVMPSLDRMRLIAAMLQVVWEQGYGAALERMQQLVGR